MNFSYKNFKFRIYADPVDYGYFACYVCQCGEKYCSSHLDRTEERALDTAKSYAISHYDREHKN